MTPIGEKLLFLRARSGLTLRQVEAASEVKVSNAYLSQLETGKIGRPSPRILYALAAVYAFPYDELMEIAGYISARGAKDAACPPTNSLGELTKEEEEWLLHSLVFFRQRSKRPTKRGKRSLSIWLRGKKVKHKPRASGGRGKK